MALLRIMYLKSLENSLPENTEIIKELSNVTIINWKEEEDVSYKNSDFEKVSPKIARK